MFETCFVTTMKSVGSAGLAGGPLEDAAEEEDYEDFGAWDAGPHSRSVQFQLARDDGV